MLFEIGHQINAFMMLIAFYNFLNLLNSLLRPHRIISQAKQAHVKVCLDQVSVMIKDLGDRIADLEGKQEDCHALDQ